MNESTLPLVTMLLISYNQHLSIDQAVDGALAQDYPNLEIVISDDASSDGTSEKIRARLEHYAGSHKIKVLKNPVNLGIGGNIDHAVRQSNGELVFICAGDDISLPHRVSTVVRAWMAGGCKSDLIAAYLNDIDGDGKFHGVIRISDLSVYQSIDDWVTLGPPHVIGAGQAWTRRLFDRFDGIPKGVVGEDMVMAFRAISSGTAITLTTPLVNYRRGGITSQRKSLHAADVVRGLTRKLTSSQIELRSMLKVAQQLDGGQTAVTFLERQLDKELLIAGMFGSTSLLAKLRIFAMHPSQSLDFRIRVLTYSAAPWLLAPFFYVKRLRYRRQRQ